jgi:tetratricopeptide (TPR) repeat protein
MITESHLLGLAYLKLQQWDNAIKVLKTALVIAPTHVKINETLGDVYYKMGNKDLYLDYWKKALEQSPNNEKLKQKVKTQKDVE